MLLILEDARKKFCCVNFGPNDTKCCSDKCMAWRWHKNPFYACVNCGEVYELSQHANNCCNGAGFNVVRVGYCGRAGEANVY